MFDEISLALHPPKFVKSRKPPIRIGAPRPPCWPLPALNGRNPVILESSCEKQRGIELAYARVDPGDLVAQYPAGSQNGTPMHFMPNMTPVYAVDGGVVTYAGRATHAYAVVVDHRDGRASFYANLEGLAVIRTDLYRSREKVLRAGDLIGYVGAPHKGAFKQLHFELWQRDNERHYVDVDPRAQLAMWAIKQEYDPFTPPASVAAKEAA